MNAFDSITPPIDKLKETSIFLGEKLKVLNSAWKLHQTYHSATRDDPECTESYLEADATIIVDTNLIDEDSFGTKDITIEQYLKEFVTERGEMEDLDYAWVTINDMIKNTFDRVKDLPVFDGMKIFIHSEHF